MKVNIVGGGPSGLFLAILLRRLGISDNVRVYEQNPRDATYGFGVGLADTAIDKLLQADPGTFGRLRDKTYYLSDQVIENGDGAYTLRSTLSNGMIRRLDILTVLQERCDALGIDVSYGVRQEDLAALAEADLLVGADGANSVVRSTLESEFGTQRETRPNYFIWYGCAHDRKESALRFRPCGAGSMIAHYYSYTPEMWTFVAEVDHQSWLDIGMGRMDNAARKAIVESTFEDVLEGRSLIENKSQWSQFETVTNERWSTGNRVLIGDALYRAHFSIGSGTRLAMEDALGLATALAAKPDQLDEALADFEAHGKPRKQKLMRACERSYRWYETAHQKLDMPILNFIHDFMTRTGRMPEDRLRMAVPEFVDAYRAQVV